MFVFILIYAASLLLLLAGLTLFSREVVHRRSGEDIQEGRTVLSLVLVVCAAMLPMLLSLPALAGRAEDVRAVVREAMASSWWLGAAWAAFAAGCASLFGRGVTLQAIGLMLRILGASMLTAFLMRCPAGMLRTVGSVSVAVGVFVLMAARTLSEKIDKP